MMRINGNIFVIVLIVSIGDLYECTLDAGAFRNTNIEQLTGNMLVLSSDEKEVSTTTRAGSNVVALPSPPGL